MKLFLSLLLIFISMESSAKNRIEALIFEAAKSTSQKVTEIKLGENIAFPANISVSPKGNGSLSILNLRLKVYDSHDNGLVYGRDGVSIILTDLDGDELKELLISGVFVYTGEDETEPKIYSYFVRGYKYDKSTNKFLNFLTIGDYQPDINSEEYQG